MIKVKLGLPGGEGVNKNPYEGEVWVFSGTTKSPF